MAGRTLGPMYHLIWVDGKGKREYERGERTIYGTLTRSDEVKKIISGRQGITGKTLEGFKTKGKPDMWRGLRASGGPAGGEKWGVTIVGHLKRKEHLRWEERKIWEATLKD